MCGHACPAIIAHGSDVGHRYKYTRCISSDLSPTSATAKHVNKVGHKNVNNVIAPRILVSFIRLFLERTRDAFVQSAILDPEDLNVQIA